jgi:cytosine/adenosine deaminase-related metal-dependent hydrolase
MPLQAVVTLHMLYHKFKADNIFTGTEMLAANQVLIINTDGSIEAIVDENDAGENIQSFNGIISPGFINCHCHLELSHMKNMIPEKTGLVDFVLSVLKHRHFPEEEILTAIENAENEMLQNGIVAVGDICNTAHTLSQKAKEKLLYYNFIEVSGFVPQFAEARFQQAASIYNQFENLQSPIFNRQSIVPHAPYSVSKELFQLINQFSAGKISTIHNQETPEEDRFFKTGESGFKKLYQQLNIDISFFTPSEKSSLQTFLPWLKNASQLILVHNTFTTQSDLDYLFQTTDYKPQTFFCLCPNANLYIENSLPPIELLINNGCNIVLGTDSLASNHSLDMLSEIKTIADNFPSVPLTEILQWATINGAKAMQMDSLLGSFEKGKTPGVILIDETFDKAKRLL